MIICKNSGELMDRYPNVKIKEDRAVFKLHKDGAFTGSVIIPTVKYPVADINRVYVFHPGNLKVITDRRVIDAVDTVPYAVGHCYTNSDNVARALREIGEEPKIFTGWAFSDTNVLPVHHCWVMLNEYQLIDLSAMMTGFLKKCRERNGDAELKTWDMNRWRECLCQYIKDTEKMKNSERCILGYGDSMVYVGCEVKDGEAGRALFRQLKKDFPHHDTDRQVGDMVISPTQAKFFTEYLG